MKIIFSSQAWEDYQYWQGQSLNQMQGQDAKVLIRLNQLILEITHKPFQGMGKPEPLRGNLKGWWSRRLTKEHRIVYRVRGTGKDQSVEILQCRFHY